MKPIWESKTLWLQVVTAILGGVEAIGGTDVIPAEYQGAALIGLAILNTILRLLTTQPVTLKGGAT